MRRTWGLGCWSVGGGTWCLYSKGELVGEIVRLNAGFFAFFRGSLLRVKPYATIGNARLAVERTLRSLDSHPQSD